MVFFFFIAKLSCPSLGCEYKCQASLTGGSCYCPDGKKLAPDNKTCTDRNECLEWGFCDQLCTNTAGSYTCFCAPGYTLKNKNRCIAVNASNLLIYFAHDKAIFRMNQSGNNVKVIVNTTGASGLDYHLGKNMLYWSDIKTKRVRDFQHHSKQTNIILIFFVSRYILYN